jgi:hypothetical protein
VGFFEFRRESKKGGFSAKKIGGPASAKLLGGLSKSSPKFCGEKALWREFADG